MTQSSANDLNERWDLNIASCVLFVRGGVGLAHLVEEVENTHTCEASIVFSPSGSLSA